MGFAGEPRHDPQRRRTIIFSMSLRGLAIFLMLPVQVTCMSGGDDMNFRVLVFSGTAGFRHGSIHSGISLIQTLGALHGFSVTTTEDAETFKPEQLSEFAAVVWLNTTGDVLNETQQAAFEAYVRGGGGWVGVHAAADCEYDWPWYGGLIGGDAWFLAHPPIQTATVSVAHAGHPSTAGLPPVFSLRDEWYNFRSNPRSEVTVLLTVNEASYEAGPDAMGADHPIAWCHAYDGGRAWYTGLGHPDATYADERFQAHLLGGIQWAAGARDDAGAASFAVDR